MLAVSITLDSIWCSRNKLIHDRCMPELLHACRDSHGTLLRVRLSRTQAGSYPLKGEARAARLAFSLAEDYAADKVLLEGDSLALVSQVLSTDSRPDWLIEGEVLRYTSENVFVPLTVGGGIRDCTDANGRPIGAYELAKAVEELGVREILLNCIDCDDESNSSSFSKPNCPFSHMVILILSQRFKYAEGILLSARVSVWIGL
ncbi:Imidazole glycerol phosphate synthase hisHF, chloroplastic [Morella rubra]|uniref:Imidazole glycerol phosphate synthase hisHF, chloroplastic n=1 Tax=Morella rubra TaxID=262757 RepID=A0A6A1W915_9ROSI|nr:Imidazole glycerol phosphate synthase hisHF, chloroplastic [Morella rubra]